MSVSSVAPASIWPAGSRPFIMIGQQRGGFVQEPVGDGGPEVPSPVKNDGRCDFVSPL